jgi:hypothetical protein
MEDNQDPVATEETSSFDGEEVTARESATLRSRRLSDEEELCPWP